MSNAKGQGESYVKPHARTASAGSIDGSGRKARGLFGLACACILGLAAFLGSGASSAGAAEAFPGQGFLPDNRAWELVSPPDKNGGEPTPQSTRTRAAADCDTDCAVTFVSLTGFGDAQGTGVGTEYMAIREGEGLGTDWSTHGITPKQDPLTVAGATQIGEAVYMDEMSPDLSHGLVRAWSPLTDAPSVERVANLYTRSDLRTPGPGTYVLVSDCPACGLTQLTTNGDGAHYPFPADISVDFNHVLFQSNRNLTGNGEGAMKAYASDEGIVRLIGLIPAGSGSSCGGLDPACVLPSVNSGASIIGLGSNLRYTPHTISDDGTRAFFTAPATAGGGINNPASPAQAANRSKLYQRDSHGTISTADDTTVRINVSERTPPATQQPALYQTASADGSRVFFLSTEALTDNAPAGLMHLYMWDRDQVNDETQRLVVSATAGQFRLIFNGQETNDLPFDAPAAQVGNALDGLSTIGGVGGQVTVSGGTGDESGSSPYVITFGGSLAGKDQAAISSTSGTTPLSGGTASALISPWVKGGGHLTLIDQDREPGTSGQPDPPSATQGVIGASEDGHYVYFVTAGQLVPGKPLLFSSAGRGIYQWHDGDIRFIGNFTASSADWVLNVLSGSGSGYPWGGGPIRSRVAPDGQHLLFTASNGIGLTGYDHSATGCGQAKTSACAEFYLYDAGADELRCATCNPSGAPALADAQISVTTDNGAMTSSSHLGRALTDEGRYVFFTSGERLVPEDGNGKRDAYRYDSVTGNVALLTSGFSDTDSYFMDASADGHDAFVLTKERLSAWDVDNSYDLYDARVDGGLPEPPPVAPSCQGDSCQPAPRVVDAPIPASSSFAGPGNVVVRGRKPRCASGMHLVKKPAGKSRCVRKKSKQKRQGRNATTNRGTSR